VAGKMTSKAKVKPKRHTQRAREQLVQGRAWEGSTDQTNQEPAPLLIVRKNVFTPNWPPEATDETSEIVTRCLELIRPVPEKERACRADIVASIDWLKLMRASPTEVRWGALSAEHRQLLKLVNALRTATKILKEIDCWAVLFKKFWHPPEPDFPRAPVVDRIEYDQFCDTLESIRAQAKKTADNLQIHRGGPVLDLIKLNAAGNSFHLLKDFGAVPPTQTIGGHFYELASTLYEAATGKVGLDLSHSCKRFIKERAKGRMR
jgi:hypothetical protein